MEFDAILLPPRRAQSVAHGLWHDQTINQDLDACVATCPDKIALNAARLESGDIRHSTYRELATPANHVAIGLSRLGVGRNDAAAMQLPNWWQFNLLYLACLRIAVLNRLMPIFWERELSFMLGYSEAKVLVVPKAFRNFNHEAMARDLQSSVPSLQHIVVVDGGGADDFDVLLTAPEWETEPNARAILTQNRPGPDDITQLIYTSGTTGELKGVMHSANALMANIIPYTNRLGLDRNDLVLMVSPTAHQTGFMYGLMMPIMLHASVVLQNVWDSATATDLIRRHGVTLTMASTPFLTDLTRVVSETGSGVLSLRTFLCAGAPILGPLIEQARNVLGAKIVSTWGMPRSSYHRLWPSGPRAIRQVACALRE